MNKRVNREKPTSAKTIPVFGQPLTTEENRILMEGGAPVPIPRLASYLEILLRAPISDVDWINGSSLHRRPLILRCEGSGCSL